MSDENSEEGLAALLLRVVIDPVRRNHLYEILHPFCHECRNYLNSLKLGLYLAKRSSSLTGSDVWNELEGRYEVVERFLDQLQALYRPLTLHLVRMPIGLLFEAGRPVWAEQIGKCGRRFRLEPPQDPAEGEFDPERLRQALDSFVTWRSQVGEPGQEVSLRWRGVTGRFRVEWHEAGLTDWGLTPSTEVQDVPLALPLLAQVTSAHGGTFNMASHEGLSLSLSWPLIHERRESCY